MFVLIVTKFDFLGQGSNKDSIRWFAHSSKVVMGNGGLCTVQYPEIDGLVNFNGMDSKDGRSSTLNLDSLIGLAKGFEENSSSSLRRKYVDVCKFTVIESNQYDTLQKAFDLMSAFQDLASKQRRNHVSAVLSDGQILESAFLESVQVCGTDLAEGWQSALPRIINATSTQLVTYWY